MAWERFDFLFLGEIIFGLYFMIHIGLIGNIPLDSRLNVHAKRDCFKIALTCKVVGCDTMHRHRLVIDATMTDTLICRYVTYRRCYYI